MKIVKDHRIATAITHGGVFHADEVLATVILSKVFPDLTLFRAVEVPPDIDDSVIVYDIGGGKWDHHQKGGNGQRNGIPYASAGLIWREFGDRVCKSAPDPKKMWGSIDNLLIQGVDAIDNGVKLKDNDPRVEFSFSGMISNFLPAWDSDRDTDDAFMDAFRFATQVFDRLFASLLADQRATAAVVKAIQDNSTTGILVLDRYMPWRKAVMHPTAAYRRKANTIDFVIYPSARKGHIVSTVRRGDGRRCDFPDEWLGLQNDELRIVCGVGTALFVHEAGFIAGAETLYDAIKLACIARAAREKARSGRRQGGGDDP